MSEPAREPGDADADAGAVVDANVDKPDTSFAYRHGDKLIAVGILSLLVLLLYFNA